MSMRNNLVISLARSSRRNLWRQPMSRQNNWNTRRIQQIITKRHLF